MNGGFGTSNQTDAIAASWDRCARQYKLLHNSGRPILRLQSSEVAPRLEQIVERTGGRRGFFQHLASVAGEIGHCLVVTDADGVLVRLEHSGTKDKSDGWNGITLGSCWDERIAGTNGVSMALQTGQAFTVRGADHYFTTLRQFACTGVPVLDASGVVIGAINLVSVDRGNRADYLFSQQLLAKTAHRIQRTLIEKEFSGAMLVTLSRTGREHVLSEDALVAVDEAGMILGASSTVSSFVDKGAANTLKGQSFEAVFEVDRNTLAKVPERVLSMRGSGETGFNLAVTLPGPTTRKRVPEPMSDRQPRKRRLPPSLRQLATGSQIMATACRRAEEVFASTSMLHLEGETGTGKSALVSVLLDAKAPDVSIYNIDCATLGDSDSDREHLRMVMEQARVLTKMPCSTGDSATLIFDNVDELPGVAQAELRRFLNAREEARTYLDSLVSEGNLQIVSTCRTPLIQAVNRGDFRDDLYYLLTAARITLPPLREREHPEVLAQALASQLAGRSIELSAEATQAIRTFPFQGNVRELRSVLEHALISAEGDRISMLDLCQAPVLSEPPAVVSQFMGVPAAPELIYDERTMILDALNGSRWNVSEAARVLGMSRATINRKLKIHGIRRPS